jgi:hypothetical protein
MKRQQTFVSCIGFLLLAACTTAPRPTAEFVSRPDSPKAGAKPAADSALVLKLGPEEKGVSKVRLTGGPLQGSIVSGEARREGDAWRIDLMRLEWFDNWANGWTQASFLLDGRLVIEQAPTGWSLAVDKAPELDTVESASIRYFDTYVRDEKGLTEFSHRWDRIQALAGDLLRRFPDAARIRDIRTLRSYLFPEIYGYDSPSERGHAKTAVQGITWDTDYTKEHFAEPLRILRDSGTLFRDYEESPGLWSLALAWKDYWGIGSRSLALVEP